ncbi:MAG: S8 family serine peptidase [Planctomycetes bacterium]|nr:S8 family serine peptidase [Planctomycetota bacterium]
MPRVHFGRRDEQAFELRLDPELIAVRTRSGRSLSRDSGAVPTPIDRELADGQLVVEYPEANVEVYRVPVGKGRRSLDERKRALRASPDVRFAGGVLVDDTTREPVLYTENLFVKFVETLDPEECVALLREAGLTVKRTLHYAVNAYFVEAPEGTGQEVFALAEQLLGRAEVEYCHPELVRPRARKAIFAPQWHLQKTTVNGVAIDAHANVAAAHEKSRGTGIVIAVIDDGVDIDHPEFAGTSKIVAPRDATRGTEDPRPKSSRDNHGTACAGVAVANGVLGASGVAPDAKLLPIRLASNLGSQEEADAFAWAVDHGADVISCSWGPADGDWWDPQQPRARAFLPASTKLAIDYAVTKGRGGKGCVVLFAAGNGNESVDLDGYASYERVIAVGACNDRGRRSVYSDFGKALWCAFPSSDFDWPEQGHPAPLSTGIWTTDRRGNAGYNRGTSAGGDLAGHFANNFGGTSSACPGAAGVAALVLAVNPELRWDEVKQLLKRSCDRIDPQGGAYGADGHSTRYGYGRLNARIAVDLAQPQPQSSLRVSRRFDEPLPDLQTREFSLEVQESEALESLAVELDLKHSYVGDLVITLVPPAASGAAAIVLQSRRGGAQRDLRTTYETSNLPALASLAGKSPRGTWVLRIQDAAALDAGTLTSFGLVLRFVHPERRRLEAAPKHAATPARRSSSTARGATTHSRARTRR